MAKLIYDLPFDEYRSIDAMNSTTLRNGYRMIGGSLRRLKHAIDSVDDATTPAFRLGNLYHVAVLEPSRWDRDFKPRPDFARSPNNVDASGNRSTSPNTRWAKSAASDFERQASEDGVTVVEPGDHSTASRISSAVYAYKPSFDLVGKSLREVTAVGEIRGIPFKARIDMLANDEISDLKGTRNVGETAFGVAAARYGYGLQMAVYRELVRQATGRTLPVSILAVETSEPFDVVIYDVPEPILDEAMEDVCGLVDDYKTARETGVWPGVANGRDRIPLYWPNWAMRDEPELEWDE